jgi:hypothetical protein
MPWDGLERSALTKQVQVAHRDSYILKSLEVSILNSISISGHKMSEYDISETRWAHEMTKFAAGARERIEVSERRVLEQNSERIGMAEEDCKWMAKIE